MRKRRFNQMSILLVCTLAAVLVTLLSLRKPTTEDVCKASEECAPKIETIGGDMLWESLSRQFVSSVQY